MIVSVTSKDGVTLWTRVQAKPAQLGFVQDSLQHFAGQKTAAELLADDYYLSPECAACRAKVAA